MAAIYSVHVAINNSYKESSPQTTQFVAAKQEVRLQWEAIVSFLQRCLGYARDYVPLCQSVQAGDLMQSMAVASAIMFSARQVRVDLAKLQHSYHHAAKSLCESVGDLRSQKSLFSSTLDFNDKGLNSAFGRATQSSLYPNLLDSSAATSKALDDSLNALNDISSFWNEHCTFLSQMSRSKDELRNLIQIGHFRHELVEWTHYHDAILQSIFSISSSCDALMVAPISKTPRWRRQIGHFLQWGRGSASGADTGVSRSAPPSHRSPIVRPQNASAIEAETEFTNSSHTNTADSLQSSMTSSICDPYDLAGLVRATFMIHTCLEVFYTRSKSSNPFRKNRALVYQRLVWQADRYVRTLDKVDEVAAAGIAFSQWCQQMISDRTTKNLSNMHEATIDALNNLIEIINEYQGIDTEISADSGKRGKKNIALSDQFLSGPPPDREIFVQEVIRLDDKELFARTHTVLDDVITRLIAYRRWLDRLLSDLNEFSSVGSVPASMNHSVSKRWADHATSLTRYREEIHKGKNISQTNQSPLGRRGTTRRYSYHR